MAISKETKDFIDNLIDYYISEASSYKQIAEVYVPEVESVTDTAFGIITGCVYSGFLQAYQNQQKTATTIQKHGQGREIDNESLQLHRSSFYFRMVNLASAKPLRFY